MKWEEEKTSIVARELYREAGRLREVTSEDWAVDHMYPISGKNVSGLHVHSNLQVIPARLNEHKNNKFILTQPDEWVEYLRKHDPELFKKVEAIIPEVCEINNRFRTDIL